MKRNLYYFSLAIFFSISIFSCKKEKSIITENANLNADILKNISHNVCQQSYQNLYDESALLLLSVETLKSNPTQANLLNAQASWVNMRSTWEKTESWLFGPISANNIDPRIDTWPVDFNALESIIQSNDSLTDNYINNLDDALKGFHPIEYILWGNNGMRQASQMTARELDFLLALTKNVNTLCEEVNLTWKNGYNNELANAGIGSTAYTSQQAAFLELTDGMSGICEEVANGKINEPFSLQNPDLEESPFSNNSLTDFKNNINGVMFLYQGKFDLDQEGIEDLVKKNNLSLDQEIKAAHADAVASLNAISLPFGQAIIQQPVSVQNAIEKIAHLSEVIDGKLRPFILQFVQK